MSFLGALRGQLGEAGLLVGGDLSAYENDWRKRYVGKALAVARPASTDEVAAVMTLCAVGADAQQSFPLTGAELADSAALPGAMRRLAGQVLATYQEKDRRTELERRALSTGYARLYLTTGPRQPEAKHLYPMGVVARITHAQRGQKGVQLLVEGVERARAIEYREV